MLKSWGGRWTAGSIVKVYLVFARMNQIPERNISLVRKAEKPLRRVNR